MVVKLCVPNEEIECAFYIDDIILFNLFLDYLKTSLDPKIKKIIDDYYDLFNFNNKPDVWFLIKHNDILAELELDGIIIYLNDENKFIYNLDECVKISKLFKLLFKFANNLGIKKSIIDDINDNIRVFDYAISIKKGVSII